MSRKQKQPHAQPPLPGMEHRRIRPLDKAAASYAALRDQRTELSQEEHALKLETIRLMKHYGKTVYQHDGIEIRISTEEFVKVRVKKADDAGDDGDAPELADVTFTDSKGAQ